MKWHSKEGGTRVPFMMRWPGKIAVKATDTIVASIDLYPTLAAACGVEIQLPENAQHMDGIDLWPLLSTAKPGSRMRNELLYWHGKGQATALRMSHWKLYFNAGDKGDPDMSGGPVLFNLSSDPKELQNVADKHPDRVKQMLRHAKQRLSEIYDNQIPIGTWEGVEVPFFCFLFEIPKGTGLVRNAW